MHANQYRNQYAGEEHCEETQTHADQQLIDASTSINPPAQQRREDSYQHPLDGGQQAIDLLFTSAGIC